MVTVVYWLLLLYWHAVTTDVQSVTVEPGTTTASVTCHLATGNSCRGCRVQWRDGSGEGGEAVAYKMGPNSPTASTTINSLVPGHTYNLVACDVAKLKQPPRNPSLAQYELLCYAPTTSLTSRSRYFSSPWTILVGCGLYFQYIHTKMQSWTNQKRASILGTRYTSTPISRTLFPIFWWSGSRLAQ